MDVPVTHEPETHLHDYLRTILKYRWVVITCFAVIVGMVTIATFLQTPIYEAVTRMMIERQVPRVLNFQEFQSTDYSSDDFYQTQYEIIRSRPVLAKAVEMLRLTTRHPELANSPDPTPFLLGKLSVEPRRNTRLVDIKVQDADPKLATDLANGIAQAYGRFTLETRLKGTRDAMTWLSEQMNELKGKVEDSEIALQKYRQRVGIIAIDQQKSMTAQRIGELNKAYLDAQAARLAIEARLREMETLARTASTSPSGVVLGDNPLIQKLRTEAAELDIQLSKALKVYKEKHPEVLKIRSQIDQVNERIMAEVQVALKAAEAEYRLAKSREDTMLQRLNAAKQEVQDLSEKEVQYGVLARDAASNQQLYDLMLKRSKEAGLSGESGVTNVQVVEEAILPKVPVAPRKARNILIAAVAGLIVGVGLAFFLEYYDTSIRTPEEVERYLGLPTLGVVPLFESRTK
jgi:uncharacterized protein involved in exopolysaccharide biosynthesis